MKAKTAISIILPLLLLSFSPSLAQAGPYSDDLAKCIVQATNTEDRALLVKWMFSAASLHPALRDISTVSSEQMDQANRSTGELFMRLLTESCREESKKAVKFEGPPALQASFTVLGQVAGMELFANPEVKAGLANFNRYFDEEKLKSLGEAQ